MKLRTKACVVVFVAAVIGGTAALYIFVSTEVATFALVALIVFVLIMAIAGCALGAFPAIEEGAENAWAATKRVASNYARAPGKELDVKNKPMDTEQLIQKCDLDNFSDVLCPRFLACAHFANDVYTLGKTTGFSLVDATSPLFKAENTGDWQFKAFCNHKEERHTVFAIYYKQYDTNLTRLLIVVRGTETAEDVAQDVQATQIPMGGEPNELIRQIKKTPTKSSLFGDKPLNKAFKGSTVREIFNNVSCHKGFHDRAMSLIKQLKAYLKESELHITQSTKVKTIGHSLGGAVALLTAMSLSVNHDTHPEVYTFGAPRVLMDRSNPKDKSKDSQGKTKEEIQEERVKRAIEQMELFCDFFKKRLTVYRIQNQFDPVPTVPPLRYGPDVSRHMTKYFFVLSSVKETALSFEDEEAVVDGKAIQTLNMRKHETTKGTVPDLIRIELRERADNTENVDPGSMEDFLTKLTFLTNADTHKMSVYIERLRVLLGGKTKDAYKGDAEKDAKKWLLGWFGSTLRHGASRRNYVTQKLDKMFQPTTQSNSAASVVGLEAVASMSTMPLHQTRFQNL